jgi:hypothetical protein
MVQAAEDRLSSERAEAPDRLMACRTIPQRHVIKTLPADRADQSLRMPGLGTIRKSIAPMPDAWC